MARQSLVIILDMKKQITTRMPPQTPPPTRPSSHYLFFQARVANRGGFRPRASARSGATTTATSIANASSSASTSTTTNSTSNTHHNQNKNLKVQPPAWRASGQPHPAWRASGQRGITYPSPLVWRAFRQHQHQHNHHCRLGAVRKGEVAPFLRPRAAPPPQPKPNPKAPASRVADFCAT